MNVTDGQIFSVFISDKYASLYSTYLQTVKSEYQESIDKEVANGKDKTTINASTTNEIKAYIPSYDDTKWRFEIIKGSLFCIQSDKMSAYKVEICQGRKIKIYLLGDIDEDNKVTNGDIVELQYMIDILEQDPSYDLTEEGYSSKGILVADVNQDGTINSDDITVLQQMIDGTY